MAQDSLLDTFGVWKIFAAVAFEGSMNKAAAELGIDVSSVSRKLEKLETQLGYPLFIRSRQCCKLTAEGENVLKEIVPQMFTFSSTVENLSRSSQEVRGIVRVSIAPGLSGCVSRWLCEFQDLYPDIFFSLHSISAPEDIDPHKSDLIVWPKQEHQTYCSSADLGVIRTLILAAPGYLEKAPPLRTLADFKNHRALINGDWVCPLVLYNPQNGTSFSYKSKSTFKTDSMLTLKDAVLQELGVAIGLPQYLCDEEIRQGRLVQVLAPVESMALPFCIITPTRAPHPKKISLLLEWIRKKWREEMGAFETVTGPEQICYFGS